MRVFNIGPHRSGTKSFHNFCWANGVTSCHWPGAEFVASAGPAQTTEDVWRLYQPFISDTQAFSDLPVPVMYREAHTAFPDAKFVLVRRQPAEWLASVCRHKGEHALDRLEQFLYWPTTGRRGSCLSDYTDEELLTAYELMFDGPLRYLGGVRAQVGLFHLESPVLGQQLADFMGFELKQDIEHVAG